MTEQPTEKEYIRKLFLDEEEQKAYLEAHRLRGPYSSNRRLIREELEERIKDICGKDVKCIKNIKLIDLVFTKDGLEPGMFIPLKSTGIEIEKYFECDYYFEGDL